ncbi:glycoside hydrolase family protein [Pedobacter sp.]|uniref:glycoside hydrolase family protein n=1 Tax=Pedobacter sp. TaxID=1411316 RepID=UPI003D7F95D5
MKTSQNGKQRLIKEEGIVLHPYKDQVGKPTIGIGSTRYEDGTPVKMTDKPISLNRAMALMDNTLVEYEAAVNKATGSTVINQNQFDALVSLCYNIGVGGFLGSTVARLVKSNPSDPKIKPWFLAWNKAGDEPVLLDRREREYKLYSTPVVGVKAKYTSSDLNLRESPSTAAKIITVLPKGTEVNVLTENNGWAQVLICNNKLTGYVSAQYLK